MKIAEKKITVADEPDFLHLLGGTNVITRPMHSEFDIIALSEEGITKASVDILMSYLDISKKAFAEDILQLSVKTMERKKDTDKLDSRTSSHIIEIAKVVEHALDVFEDKDKVKLWFNAPNRALNNMKPIQLFSNYTGLNMVNTILGRIEYGIFS